MFPFTPLRLWYPCLAICLHSISLTKPFTQQATGTSLYWELTFFIWLYFESECQRRHLNIVYSITSQAYILCKKSKIKKINKFLHAKAKEIRLLYNIRDSRWFQTYIFGQSNYQILGISTWTWIGLIYWMVQNGLMFLSLYVIYTYIMGSLVAQHKPISSETRRAQLAFMFQWEGWHESPVNQSCISQSRISVNSYMHGGGSYHLLCMFKAVTQNKQQFKQWNIWIHVPQWKHVVALTLTNWCITRWLVHLVKGGDWKMINLGRIWNKTNLYIMTWKNLLTSHHSDLTDIWSV